jgi:putative ABC transport system ATP-binding protein
MVKIEGLNKIYHQGKVMALENINLRVAEGEFLSILGPSGSGKTTLLNIIGALDKPTTGKVFIDGVDLYQVTDLPRFRAERIGFVFQLHNLIPTLNALENVQLPMYAIRIAPKERKLRAEELLNAVGLEERQNHFPASLSGGERQRVAIARALVNNPSLILADEPTGTLDPETAEEIIQLILDLNAKTKTTIIMVTHDLKVAQVADSFIYLIGGKIAEKVS